MPSFLEVLSKHNPDQDLNIILGCESWLTANIASSEIFPNEYNVFRKDRQTKTGGGVFIACRNTITFEEVDVVNNCEIVIGKVTLQNKRHNSLIL